ncbi:hypothetical protein ACLOJK_022627 [Asimina triloba]
MADRREQFHEQQSNPTSQSRTAGLTPNPNPITGGDSKQSKQWKALMEIKSFSVHSRKGNMITIEPSTSSSRQG